VGSLKGLDRYANSMPTADHTAQQYDQLKTKWTGV